MAICGGFSPSPLWAALSFAGPALCRFCGAVCVSLGQQQNSQPQGGASQSCSLWFSHARRGARLSSVRAQDVLLPPQGCCLLPRVSSSPCQPQHPCRDLLQGTALARGVGWGQSAPCSSTQTHHRPCANAGYSSPERAGSVQQR